MAAPIPKRSLRASPQGNKDRRKKKRCPSLAPRFRGQLALAPRLRVGPSTYRAKSEIKACLCHWSRTWNLKVLNQEGGHLKMTEAARRLMNANYFRSINYVDQPSSNMLSLSFCLAPVLYSPWLRKDLEIRAGWLSTEPDQRG